MTDYIEQGRHLSSQYQEVCAMIMTITDRMAEEYEALYEMAYKAREMSLPEKNRGKSSPVESAVILIEKMRNEMDSRYCSEIAELERKRMDIEGIVESAGLSAVEQQVFYLRYGIRRKRLSLDEIADMVFYSQRHVKRVLERCYDKVGAVL
ncbi:MAG: sigma factor-like helix-turn-helix DNA-binding protein [Eubacteriales bacterium]